VDATFPFVALDILNHVAEQDRAYFRESREEPVGMPLETFLGDRETNRPALQVSLAPMRRTLKAQPFFGGDRPLYADYVMFGPFQSFAELAQVGRDRAKMSCLRAVGLRAEAAMLTATGGIDTHRGTIFGLGLLCAAAGMTVHQSDGHAATAPLKLGDVVSRNWRDDIRRGPIPLYSHGGGALRRCGASGVREEAAPGFPSICNIGSPALWFGRAIAPQDAAAGPVQACFAFIAAVPDTNLLHRGGVEGARYASEAAAAFLSDGGVGAQDWPSRAVAVHAGFVARHLSPGGCADPLAMTLFVDALESGTSLQ
jgi:triphosphoribosyl-dephospho-CoA synthase